MLRALVLVLVLANLAFFVWSQGWLDGDASSGDAGLVGVRSIGDREPERLGRQVRPEAVTLLPNAAPGGGGGNGGGNPGQ